ncbi:hypothetical protein D1872_320070 [compost metagenome]
MRFHHLFFGSQKFSEEDPEDTEDDRCDECDHNNQRTFRSGFVFDIGHLWFGELLNHIELSRLRKDLFFDQCREEFIDIGFEIDTLGPLQFCLVVAYL